MIFELLRVSTDKHTNTSNWTEKRNREISLPLSNSNICVCVLYNNRGWWKCTCVPLLWPRPIYWSIPPSCGLHTFPIQRTSITRELGVTSHLQYILGALRLQWLWGEKSSIVWGVKSSFWPSFFIIICYIHYVHVNTCIERSKGTRTTVNNVWKLNKVVEIDSVRLYTNFWIKYISN